METYIALFLLIMPGYLAKIVNGHLCDNININDKFKLTMEALLYDAVIIPAVYVLIHLQTADIDNVPLFFSNMKNIMVYGAVAIAVSLASGVAWKWGALIYQGLINWLRGEGNNITIGKSVFNISFNDGKVHLIEIYKNGDIIGRGYLSCMYFDNQEIVLEDAQEIFDLLDQYNGKEYKKIYLDFANGILIKEIDMEKYEQK